MKFKVGDRVRLRSLQWYLENKDENGKVVFWKGYNEKGEEDGYFIGYDQSNSIYCGMVAIIRKVCEKNEPHNYLTYLYGEPISLVDEMLEPDPVVFEYAIEINGRLEPDIYYTEAEAKIALDVWKKARPMDDVKLRTLTLE